MLDAGDRTYISDALTSPPEYRFDEALITTYSLDLTTLLVIPLFLALRGGSDVEETLEDSISVFEALSRIASRIVVLCEAGRIGASGSHFKLYSMLEDSVFTAHSPMGGAFHPKVWVLRFIHRDDPDQVFYRLCVMSRNVQRTLHWDIALVLEGVPSREFERDDLVRFIEGQPDLVDGSERLRSMCTHFADELGCVEWELPEGFDTVEFFAYGFGDEGLPLPLDSRLGVISPFIGAGALSALAKRRQPSWLVARSTELSRIKAKNYKDYKNVCVLDEAAEAEEQNDASDVDESDDHQFEGLHAKLYMTEKDGSLRVLVGSGNATNPVWCNRTNIEFFAALDGPIDRVGSLDDFFGVDGFGRFLVPFDASEQDEADADEQDKVQLEVARSTLARTCLKMRCHQEGGLWMMEISSPQPLELDGIEKFWAWPATRDGQVCRRDARGLLTGQKVDLPAGSLAFLSRFVAFELEDESGQSLRFIVKINDVELPPKRDAALMSHLLRNGGGFLRYVRLLLASDDSFGVFEDIRRRLQKSNRGTGRGAVDDVALLEPMVRAYCRGDKRLHILKRRVDELRKLDEAVIPPEFDEVWETFESLLDDDFDGKINIEKKNE